jgi:hypothetical protein
MHLIPTILPAILASTHLKVDSDGGARFRDALAATKKVWLVGNRLEYGGVILAWRSTTIKPRFAGVEGSSFTLNPARRPRMTWPSGFIMLFATNAGAKLELDVDIYFCEKIYSPLPDERSIRGRLPIRRTRLSSGTVLLDITTGQPPRRKTRRQIARQEGISPKLGGKSRVYGLESRESKRISSSLLDSSALTRLGHRSLRTHSSSNPASSADYPQNCD